MADGPCHRSLCTGATVRMQQNYDSSLLAKGLGSILYRYPFHATCAPLKASC